MNRRDKRKLDRMVEIITESHLEIYGGYPYDYMIGDDYLYVAQLDDGKDRVRTKLVLYEIGRLLEWHDDAADYAKENRVKFDEAFWETRPDDIGQS